MLKVDRLSKQFIERGRKAPVQAVSDVSFVVEDGVFLTLLGPSGCGKTTTLRAVAGLERPDAGTIKLDGMTLFSSEKKVDVPAHKRGLGMVFQSYAIWPHMNVFENVAFPLRVVEKRNRLSRAEIKEKVSHILNVVQLYDLGDRPATDLSGGQQQRLALARALISEPRLLLLDEPLSNLDAKLREDLRFELKRLQREVGITTLYVTHDQAEALSMSNVVAVMNNGVIQQVGHPREIYERPASAFVADFIGTSNFIEGKVTGRNGGGVYEITTGGGVLLASLAEEIPQGRKVIAAVRPEQIELTEGQADFRPGVWKGVIRERAFLGEALDYIVEAGSLRIKVRANSSLNIPTGTEVSLTIPPHSCSLLPDEPTQT